MGLSFGDTLIDHVPVEWARMPWRGGWGGLPTILIFLRASSRTGRHWRVLSKSNTCRRGGEKQWKQAGVERHNHWPSVHRRTAALPPWSRRSQSWRRRGASAHALRAGALQKCPARQACTFQLRTGSPSSSVSCQPQWHHRQSMSSSARAQRGGRSRAPQSHGRASHSSHSRCTPDRAKSLACLREQSFAACEGGWWCLGGGGVLLLLLRHTASNRKRCCSV